MIGTETSEVQKTETKECVSIPSLPTFNPENYKKLVDHSLILKKMNFNLLKNRFDIGKKHLVDKRRSVDLAVTNSS